VAIAVTAVVLLVLVMPQLPTTERAKLPPDPKAREKIVRTESTFKGLVALSILCAAGAVAAFPLRKLISPPQPGSPAGDGA
jgi:hypothetical protein